MSLTVKKFGLSGQTRLLGQEWDLPFLFRPRGGRLPRRHPSGHGGRQLLPQGQPEKPRRLHEHRQRLQGPRRKPQGPLKQLFRHETRLR